MGESLLWRLQSLIGLAPGQEQEAHVLFLEINGDPVKRAAVRNYLFTEALALLQPDQVTMVADCAGPWLRFEPSGQDRPARRRRSRFGSASRPMASAFAGIP